MHFDIKIWSNAHYTMRLIYASYTTKSVWPSIIKQSFAVPPSLLTTIKSGKDSKSWLNLTAYNQFEGIVNNDLSGEL